MEKSVDKLIIIQARMGSSRLPGKVLKSLGQTSILDHVVQRCRQINGDAVILATSVLPADDAISSWCQMNQVACFRGSEEDVLSRYAACAELYQPNWVIRVTADCPFLDVQLANKMMGVLAHTDADLISLDRDLPRGLAVEVMRYSALLAVHERGTEARHREHVTYYAYEHPEQFKLAYVHVPDVLHHPHLRMTVDTVEDYQLCQTLAQHIPDIVQVPSAQIVQYLLEHPEVARLNAHIQQKPVC
ncbi:cytidylyltransferase domain-containing protein [Marinicrinis sediminis]|uniref:Cytidylyltransferase domain-containing protein n=1 Tax=Marinicrinis sediminis TaxID=1652465 RepID=A0ABW5RAD1_9BACL